MTRFLLPFFIVILLVVAAITSYWNEQNRVYRCGDPLPATSELSIHGQNIVVEIARSLHEKICGLSHRQNLSHSGGMLFEFGKRADTHGLWMKNMNFAIDIIWLDEDFRVVDIDANVTPGSFPEVFRPRSPALFALEVREGFSEQHKVREGDVFRLNSPEERRTRQ